MIDIREVTSGNMNGKLVYICDLRYDDYSNKPIRNVKPTKVLIRPNSETKKRIYYSESHFVGLNKKGEPLKSKVIPVFDNTGYRYRTGTPVNCFNSEQECKEFYTGQVREAILGLDNYKENLISMVDDKITVLRESLV